MTRRGKKTLWLATAVYAAALMTASLLPSGEGPMGGWDASISPDLQDALHLPAYAGLVVLLALSWSTRSPLTTRKILAIACACLAFGVAMELAQSVIPGRTCSLGDGLVNTTGTIIGLALAFGWRQFSIRRSLTDRESPLESGLAKQEAADLGPRPPISPNPYPDAVMSGHTMSHPIVCMLVTNRGVDDPRVRMEAEALAGEHYSVTVIGWDRDVDEDIDQKQNGVRFLRLRLRSSHGRGMTQPVFLAGFWFRAWRTIRKLRPAVIHCHDLDTLPLGWLASRTSRAKLVFDAHENFPDMMVGHLPAFAVAALRLLERQLVPRSDLLITVGNLLAQHYRGLGARNVVVVGNWKDPADFVFPEEVLRQTRAELGLRNGVIAICFVANLGHERRLEPLLQAVAQDPRFACVIGGDGPQAELARQYAVKHKSIIYLGRVPASRVPLITAACDVVYYGFDETNPNARWSAPNKLYESIAAGKPMLTGSFGEIGDTVRSAGCGILADQSSPHGIAAALKHLASLDDVETMGRRAAGLRGTLCQAEAIRRLQNAYSALARGKAPMQASGMLPDRKSQELAKGIRPVGRGF